MVGAAIVTTSDSQADLVGTLFKSPEYNASKLKLPAALKLCSGEVGTAWAVRVTSPTLVGLVEQADPLKYSYVTVPVAWNELASVAESDTEPPTGIVEAERLVVIVGLFFNTETMKLDE